MDGPIFFGSPSFKMSKNTSLNRWGSIPLLEERPKRESGRVLVFPSPLRDCVATDDRFAH